MGVFTHHGRTGKVRADFLADACEWIEEQNNALRLLIKGIVIGRVWLARGEEVREGINIPIRVQYGHGFRPGVGRVWRFKKAKRVRKSRKKVDSTICRWHGDKLDANGKCTGHLRLLSVQQHQSSGPIGNTD